jgi:hypothetical protein
MDARPGRGTSPVEPSPSMSAPSGIERVAPVKELLVDIAHLQPSVDR